MEDGHIEIKTLKSVRNAINRIFDEDSRSDQRGNTALFATEIAYTAIVEGLSLLSSTVSVHRAMKIGKTMGLDMTTSCKKFGNAAEEHESICDAAIAIARFAMGKMIELTEEIHKKAADDLSQRN